jgi:hypothetical protein
LSTPFSVVEDLLWGLADSPVLFLFQRARSHAAMAVMTIPANRHPIASPTAWPVESPLELLDAEEVVPELAEVCVFLVTVDGSS